MGVSAFYFISLIPVAIGALLFITHHKVVWWEWLVGSAIAFAVSGLMHGVALLGMTGDIEMWSGRVTRVVFYPRWVEEYQQMHTRQVYAGTDSNGNAQYRMEIYYTTEYRTHHERWEAETTLSNYPISQDFYHQIADRFGGVIETVWAHKSGFHEGDHNIYPANNRTNWLQPVNDTYSWTNRVKATPSVFSFQKVPKNVKVYDWPSGISSFESGRLLGLRGDITQLEFDQMNARLGPTKKVNVILIGFGPEPLEIAKWQESKWIGGKKNDLVICFGGNPNKPTWSYTFGWTESATTKRNLETLVLTNGVSSKTLPLLEKEISSTFTNKDWKKFDYLTIEPPTWSYVTLICVMVASQVGFWLIAFNNYEDKRHVIQTIR